MLAPLIWFDLINYRHTWSDSFHLFAQTRCQGPNRSQSPPGASYNRTYLVPGLSSTHTYTQIQTHTYSNRHMTENQRKQRDTHLGLLYGSFGQRDAREWVHRPLHGVAPDPGHRVQDVLGQLGLLCQVIQCGRAFLHGKEQHHARL